MNAYIADQIAREHNNRLLSDAKAARRARRANRSRRAAATTTRSRASSNESRSTADRSRPATQPGAAAAHLVARPVTAFRSWLLAGQL
ncbi:MAG TPA: hypothetical protein VE442_08500 [Jatrophihabitans sp.]|jgi:hypothetical protein|nr:hypothetical protein [Jatrophihabitans sp.]